MRTLTIFIFLLCLFAVPANRVLAAGTLTAAPVVIDVKGKARDILRETITVKNTTNHKASYYAVVNNVTAGSEGGVQQFTDWSQADKKISLANWISVSRGVIELLPGEERSLDVGIDINLDARPGVYHAAVSFGEGSNRDDAVNHIRDGATTMINVEVIENVVEFMQLRKFAPLSFFSWSANTALAYELENIGNRPLVPKGEIIIYDRRGREVGTVAVNPGGVSIAPGEKKSITTSWTGKTGMGRYKAYLAGSYGAGQMANLTDTTYFFVFPWKSIAALFTALSLIVAALAIVWHRQRMSIAPAASAVHASRPVTAPPPGLIRTVSARRVTGALSLPKVPSDVSHIKTVNLRPVRRTS